MTTPLKERQGGGKSWAWQSRPSCCMQQSRICRPGARRAKGLNIDGREYIVNDWSEDMGVATIALGQTVTM